VTTDRDPVDTRALLARLDAAAAAPASEGTLAVCDSVIAQVAPSTNAPALARALFEKARALSRLGRTNESHSVVAELVRRFEHEAEPALRRLVCRSLFGQAKDRLSGDHADRRIVIADYRLILHIAERPPRLDASAAEALYHLALTHAKIAVERSNPGHEEKATERFLEIETRYAEADNPAIARWVVRAAASHALMHDLATAGAIYERAIGRYERAGSTALHARAVELLAIWARRCLDEGKPVEADAIAERALGRFRSSEDPEVRASLEQCIELRASAQALIPRG
jgi:hypothetical protein